MTHFFQDITEILKSSLQNFYQNILNKYFVNTPPHAAANLQTHNNVTLVAKTTFN